MKAVVTGSAGFVGRNLVDELVARGYWVTGIDRQPVASGTGYGHVTADLATGAAHGRLAEIAAESDVVFHLAARPGVRSEGPHVARMRERDNVTATRNLLSSTPADIPVVAASSSSVYGGSRPGVASREDDPLRPRGGYALSKVAMERLCEERRARGGLVAVLRPFTVAGEGQRRDMAFSLWLEALRNGEPIRIFGSEQRSRDITDIREAVQGFIRAGERRLNETVNLGTGVGHTLIEMATTLMDVSGRSGEVVYHPASPVEVDATCADTGLCRELLGFVPTTDLPGLLARQIAATVPTKELVST